MRTLGIDIGSKRMGLALSDELGITAQGIPTFIHEEGKNVIEYIKNLVKDKNVGEIVIGLPLNMNGSQGEKAKEAIEFADKIKNNLNVPVKLWDERMTSLEVNRIMIDADISRSKRKKKRDKLAAQLILQSYLNAKATT